jgi:hypothetical protein
MGAILAVCRRNGCRISPALDALSCVLRFDAVQTAPALCVLATNVDAAATPRHHFRDKPLAARGPMAHDNGHDA